MFCPQCGNEIPDQSAFCPKCGQNIKPKGEAPVADGMQAPTAAPAASAPTGKKTFKPLFIIIAAIAVAAIVALCICIPKCAGGKAVDSEGHIAPSIVVGNTTIDKIQKQAEKAGYGVQVTDEGGYQSYHFQKVEGSDDSGTTYDNFTVYVRGENIVGAEFNVEGMDSTEALQSYVGKYTDFDNVSYYTYDGTTADAMLATCDIDGQDGIVLCEVYDGDAEVIICSYDFVNEQLGDLSTLLDYGNLGSASALKSSLESLLITLGYTVID